MHLVLVVEHEHQHAKGTLRARKRKGAAELSTSFLKGCWKWLSGESRHNGILPIVYVRGSEINFNNKVMGNKRGTNDRVIYCLETHNLLSPSAFSFPFSLFHIPNIPDTGRAEEFF